MVWGKCDDLFFVTRSQNIVYCTLYFSKRYINNNISLDLYIETLIFGIQISMHLLLFLEKVLDTMFSELQNIRRTDT